MTYEEAIFAKLADNGLSGCRAVVGADARKWGRFGGISSGPAAFWLGGGTGSRNFCSVLINMSELEKLPHF